MSLTQIRISGSGGQGLLLSAAILAQTLTNEGKAVARSQSYEPTSRGGLSRSDLVIGEAGDGFPLATELDYLVILDQCAAHASDHLIKPGATVLIDPKKVTTPPTGDFTALELPALDIALALGNRRAANVVALGALVGLSGLCDFADLEVSVRARTPASALDVNMEALAKGRQWAEQASAEMEVA